MDIEKKIGTLLEKAIASNVSDIHVMPEGKGYVCLFRQYGSLRLEERLDHETGTRNISFVKFLGNMDVGERRRPQSGSASWVLKDVKQDLRFSTITNFKQDESLVIRLLAKADGLELEKQTFFVEDVETLKRLVRYKSGLLLFSGAVGMGKTTTMYQLVRAYTNTTQQQVITVEDPVEVEEPSFLQCQVNEKAGVTYETLLKSSLRHHPDILIVGEIRDEETAKMVIRGALTGHLMIASVHAKNASGVLERLLELGISHTVLKQTVLGIAYQKLLPRYCALCETGCSVYCTHLLHQGKRAALYDVRHGSALERLLQRAVLSSKQPDQGTNKGGEPDVFNQRMRKAWAYGYITTATYETYIIP